MGANKLLTAVYKKVPMTIRSVQKAKTRRALIEAALRLSAAQGFSGIGLREVTREAEVAPTTFYRHFQSMEELGLVLIDEVGLSLRRLMRQAAQRVGQQGKDMIQTAVEAFMEFIYLNTNLFRLFLGERMGSSTAFRKELKLELNRFIDELTAELDQAVSRSKYNLYETRLTAEAIIAVTFTLGAEALDLPTGKLQALSERIVQEVRIILKGSEALAKP